MAIKKEYLVGGVLGAVICGIVVFAVMGGKEGGTGRQQIQQVSEPPAVAQQSAGHQDEAKQAAPDPSPADNPNTAASEKKPANEPSSSAGESSSDGKADDKKPVPEKTSSAAQNSEEKLVKGLTPDQIKRLDEINERKAVLKPEREKLIKEREQLHEDVRNAGVVRFQAQIDAIAKRITDLEGRIKGYNEEVKKLNEEEKAITEGLGKIQ